MRLLPLEADAWWTASEAWWASMDAAGYYDRAWSLPIRPSRRKPTPLLSYTPAPPPRAPRPDPITRGVSLLGESAPRVEDERRARAIVIARLARLPDGHEIDAEGLCRSLPMSIWQLRNNVLLDLVSSGVAVVSRDGWYRLALREVAAS